jgi:hypothetical protein
MKRSPAWGEGRVDGKEFSECRLDIPLLLISHLFILCTVACSGNQEKLLVPSLLEHNYARFDIKHNTLRPIQLLSNEILRF